MAEKILVIGGSGYIGKFIVEASVKLGHPTFTLVTETSFSDPNKAHIIDGFNKSGVTILTGDRNDHDSLVKAIKQVDVVISAVGFMQILEQSKIIAAIKEAGNVKRFVPSEYGNDVDICEAVEPINSQFKMKVQIRRAIEAAGIPYTYVVSNMFAGFALSNFLQIGSTTPPREKIVIPGDGTVKAGFSDERDIGLYTLKAAVDPRAENKVLYILPPQNILSFNDLCALWEKKIGNTLEKIYVSEEDLLKQIQEAPIPVNFILSINHCVFIQGGQTAFEIDPKTGVEASKLYPDVKYTTVDEYLDQLVYNSLRHP